MTAMGDSGWDLTGGTQQLAATVGEAETMISGRDGAAYRGWGTIVDEHSLRVPVVKRTPIAARRLADNNCPHSRR